MERDFTVRLENDPPRFSDIPKSRLELFARDLTRAVRKHKEERKKQNDANNSLQIVI